MSVCLVAGTKAVVVATSLFTLSWTHSVEKVRWEEDWRLTPAGLIVEEARVKGSGAGMDPPEGAAFSNGWWRYRPTLAPIEELRLGVSGATGQGWRLCADGRCLELEDTFPAAESIAVARCTGE